MSFVYITGARCYSSSLDTLNRSQLGERERGAAGDVSHLNLLPVITATATATPDILLVRWWVSGILATSQT